MAETKRMTTRQFARAITEVAKLSYKTAPAAIGFKLAGIAVTAGLPIIITYFAARTTTELAAAFTGTPGAGRLALIYIAITAALGLISTAWDSIDQYVQQIMRYKVEAKVSDMMYEQFLSLDFWQYDDKDTADLYDKANKFSQFFAYVFDRLANLVSELVTLVVTIIALFIFLPWIALFVFIAVLPGVYYQFKISRAQIDHWNKHVDSRRVKGYIEWNLLQPHVITEIRLNGLVRYLLDLRQKLRDKDEKGRLDFERKFIGKRLFGDILVALTELGSLVWIAVEIINQRQPIGQFVYVQQLVSRAMGSANGFVGQLSTLDEDLANLFDYQAFMDLPTRQGGTKKLANKPSVISFENVSFVYRGSKQNVLHDVSMRITAGQHVAIVGENGAGKSTFIKLFTGLYRPSKGNILVDGQNLNEVDVVSWHKQLSVLNQDFYKYNFTDVQDNVYFGDVSKPLDTANITTSLAAAEATDFVDKLPRKLQTYPNTWMEDDDGNKGVALSGGQWQRLALARNFYRNAPIIILDEPTSAIDALAEGRIFDRLFSKANGQTVITVSHRLSTVEKADVIYVLENGKIVEQGTHTELVAKDGAYCRLFKRQLPKS